MSAEEIQHFAPKVYLRAFVDPALAVKSKHQVWVYAAATVPESKGVRRVGGFQGYYEIGVPGQERLAEDQFNKVESLGAPILKKLRAGDIKLTTGEKETFALFIASFFARVPASRELIDAVQAETRRQNFEFILQDPVHVAAVARSISERGRWKAEPEHVAHLARKIAIKEIPIPPITRAENIAEIFRIALEWQTYLAPMVWGLCEAPEGTAFITSDNPVHMIDEGARAVKYDDYVGPTTGLRFGFPLSPRFMLTGEYLPAKDQAMKVDAAWVAKANQAQIYRALREVYASFHSPELREKIDRIHVIRKPVIPEFPAAWT